MKEWVTLQLSEKGEITLEEEPCIIENVIKKLVKGDYFFPVFYDKKRNYDNKIFLFRGYIFVEYLKENKVYSEISNSPYFVGPLMINRRLHLLPDIKIRQMKKQLTKLTRPSIKAGDRVRLLDGKYKSLDATVTEYYKKEKEADLKIELKCMHILVPRVPIVYLKNINIEERNNNTLKNKILTFLNENNSKLSRREIIEKMGLSNKEIKRISTCLSRMVESKTIQSKKNSSGNFLFFIEKN